MTAEVCPYCRAPISAEDAATTCEGCATRHHADCYTENGGCTIFGCKYAPAEEPKLTVSTPELVSVAHSAAAGSSCSSSPTGRESGDIVERIAANFEQCGPLDVQPVRK